MKKPKRVIINPTDKVAFSNGCLAKGNNRILYTGYCNGKEFVDFIEKLFVDSSKEHEKLSEQISRLKHALIECMNDYDSRIKIASIVANPDLHDRC